MKKSIRNLILATAVAVLSAASMHAAVTGSAPLRPLGVRRY
jgi:hypothetical protein